MEQKTPLPSPKSDHPLKLKLKQPHLSEDDYIIKQEGPFMSHTQTPSASKSCLCSDEETAKETIEEEDSGRERLKRLRVEAAGRVWIPELWGQEELLKDWIDCSAFHAPFVPTTIMTARAALVREGRRPNICCTINHTK